MLISGKIDTVNELLDFFVTVFDDAMDRYLLNKKTGFMFHDESLKHMLIDHHQGRIILYRLV